MFNLVLFDVYAPAITESVGTSFYELFAILLFGIALFVSAMFIRRASKRAAAIEREKEITK